ncbi:ASCH domain-containing protein [Halobacteriales archaeon QS_4_69_34]|nr:MAG: ASCH domain-containing protein [Halobacteriales archaeon QS_4_69_34]
MSLLFQPKHIESIRAGEKTATRRDWAEGHNRPAVGSIQMAVRELFTSDAACDCYIEIEAVYRQSLGAMDEADARAEGGYTLAEFRDAWQEINGDGAWDENLVVDVVEFRYVGRSRPTES